MKFLDFEGCSERGKSLFSKYWKLFLSESGARSPDALLLGPEGGRAGPCHLFEGTGQC